MISKFLLYIIILIKKREREKFKYLTVILDFVFVQHLSNSLQQSLKINLRKTVFLLNKP